MSRLAKVIHLAMWGALLALLTLPIILAPVMREPTRTMSATAYFGKEQP